MNGFGNLQTPFGNGGGSGGGVGPTDARRITAVAVAAIAVMIVGGLSVNSCSVTVESGYMGIKTTKFKLPRAMLEWTVGMSGKVVQEIANDTNTKIVVAKPPMGSKETIFSITGKVSDVDAAQYIFQQIVKANKHRLTTFTVAT